MSFSSIKISHKTKEDLDSFRLDKESYNIAIQRLMLENKSLKEDKNMLMKIAMQTSDSIALININHSVIFALVQVLKDKESSDDEKLNALKIYLRPCLDDDVNAVLSNIDEFKQEYENYSHILDDLIAWINKSYS